VQCADRDGSTNIDKKKLLYLRSGLKHYGLAILRPYIYNIGQKQIFVVFVALAAGPSGN
jgi:hypothetical protein